MKLHSRVAFSMIVLSLSLALISCSGGNAAPSPPQNPQPQNPQPSITSVTPTSVSAGGLAFTLTVRGLGFVRDSVVRWNGADRATIFVNSAQVTATILATDIASMGTAQLTVFNPAPDGGTSNQLTFTVGPAPLTSPQAYVTRINASLDSGTVLVIDTGSNTLLTNINVGTPPRGVAVSLDGTRAYVTTSGAVLAIARSTNSVVATIGVHGNPSGIAVSPDGSRAYVTLSNSTVSVIDTMSNTVVSTIPVGMAPSCVAFTNDGARAYVINSSLDYGSVSVIDTISNTVIATIPTNIHTYVAVTPDGTRAYMTSVANDAVSVIDTGTNTFVAAVESCCSPTGLAFTPDGTRVYVANHDTNDVSVIDCGSDAIVARIAVGISPDSVAVSSDGTRVYVTNGGSQNDGSVSVIDTVTNTVLATVNVSGLPCCEMGIAIQRLP